MRARTKRRTDNIVQHRRQLEKKVKALESETQKLFKWNEIERDLQKVERDKDKVEPSESN